MRRAGIAALAFALGFAACTDAYLFDPRAGRRGAEDRAIRVTGELCTEAASEVRRPVKLLFAMDTSQSMGATDPNGSRAQAFVELLDTLPESPEIELGVLLFAGDVTWLTNGGASGFQQLVAMSPMERQRLAATILTYAYAGAPGEGGPNRDTTDFIKPLDEIFSTISRDIANARAAAAAGGEVADLAHYHVVFLSDGHPRSNPDPEIFARCKAIRALRSEAGEVVFNAVHVFLPDQAIPTSCPDPNDCQARIVEQDAARLRGMAELGGGEFRSFRNGEPINFLFFRLAGIKRAFVIKELQVFNTSAGPGSSGEQADSDGDGLSDAREAELHTDPTLRDSDGDGFSDGVEQYFRERGGPFRPHAADDGSTLDPGCPAEQVGADADEDGLLDCDEQLIGTSSSRFDSDGDGLPDLFEWLGGSQPSSRDAEEDPDRDGLVNAVEVRMHTDPQLAESGRYSDLAYRYRLGVSSTARVSGSLCYGFEVDNVLLVPTIDRGEGPGINELVMSIAQVAGDDLEGPPIYRVARFRARYPVDGIKDPPDGVIALRPEDFVQP